jgi:hypothetical protein
MQRGRRHTTCAVEMNCPLMRLDDESTAAATDQTNVEGSLTHGIVLLLEISMAVIGRRLR